MSIDTLKLEYIGKRLQVVLLDNNGCLVETCHTLLPLPDPGTSLFDSIVLLDSLRHQLIQLKAGDNPLFFPNIEFSYHGQTIAVDFTFFVHPQKNDQLVWILDNDPYDYHILVNMQQERNELAIRSFNHLCNKKMVENLQTIDHSNEQLYAQLNEQKNIQQHFALPAQRLENILNTLHEYVGKMYLRELADLTQNLQNAVQQFTQTPPPPKETTLMPLLSLLHVVSNALSVNPQIGHFIITMPDLHHANPNIALPNIPFRQILYNWLYTIATHPKSVHIAITVTTTDDQLQILISHKPCDSQYASSYHWKLCQYWLQQTNSTLILLDNQQQSLLETALFSSTTTDNSIPNATRSAINL